MSAELYFKVFEPIENMLVKSGIKSASQAGAVVAVGVGAGLWLTKPAAMFENGYPRSWSLFANVENGTAVPWWLAAATTGWVVSLII